ncbi:MAG: hypothetical protein ACI9GH_000639 [Candidatus Paceibacteria bacterium]|jgi:hypothetical protein
MIRRIYQKNSGLVLVNSIVFASIAIIMITGIVAWLGSTIETARRVAVSEQAFQIAEAGVDYYRWHLAHDADDYQDGTGVTGPYVHEFTDSDGVRIGEFSLDITPPPIGSTLVVIESTGVVDEWPQYSRTIQTQLAIPSFAKYAFVADSDMRFGEGTEVFGPIHTNGGIRFDGLAHNLVSSSRSDYDDPDHSGDNEFGVHTHDSPTDPLPPSTVPDRFDIFEAGRQFPVPAVDFDGLLLDLANIKTDAEADGHSFAASGSLGYRIVLKTDDTFDLYRVTSLVNPDWSCTNPGQSGWGSWSIQNDTLIANYDNPNNGLIFLEDHVWVEGQIDSARITIAAGRFPDVPSTRRSITINTNLLYTNYDGQDTISLIAQDNINIGLVSDDTFRIDAALIAQNGRVGRYYYRPNFWWYPGCTPNHSRNTVTLYGMIGTKNRYGFAYTDGNGYDTRNIIYDANLLYAPPPNFPLTSEQYETISWEEIEN